MATLAITGLISNLDTDTIINALVEMRRGPLNLLEQKKAVQNNKMVALQNLNARMLNFSVAAQSLSRSTTFQTFRATSTNASVVSASTNSTAAAGSHTVIVNTLAQAQSFAGDIFESNTDALGLSGQFRLDGRLITVNSTDSLNTIAASINSQAGSTVRASVLQVGDEQFRLTISRRATGAESAALYTADGGTLLQDLGLTTGSTTVANPVTNGGQSGAWTSETAAVGTLLGLGTSAPSGTVTLDDGTGPIQVAIDLGTDSLQAIATAINNEAALQGSPIAASVETETVGGILQFRLQIAGAADVTFTDDQNVLQTLEILRPELADEVQAGQDASFSVNGVAITRNTNLVSGVITGVTLLLNSTDPGNPVTLTISQSSDNATAAIQSFVDTYNSARSYVREATAYNPETRVAGVLLGDSAVMAVERNMFDIVGARVANVLLKDLSVLNAGAGVDTGKINITDRSGAAAEIDLSSITTVQGIINTINSTSGISVTASANSTGDGILLTDTSGGTGAFTVEDLDGGTMAADLGLAQSLRSNILYGASVTDAGFASLADIGISSNNTGFLSLDAAKLSQALQNDPKMVERLFSVRTYGVGQVAAGKVELITRAQGGAIANRTTALQKVIDDIDDRIEIGERRLLVYEERLQRQFTALEQTLALYQSQSEYLNNQLTNIGNIFNRNNR